MHTTELSFSYGADSVAAMVYQSVRQEQHQIPGDRATGTVRQTDTGVKVDIEAEDLAALRAGVHTWCSLVETAEDTVGSIE